MQRLFLSLARPYWSLAAGMSFIISLLMLNAPVYMTHVYGRVLASKSLSTLLVLSAIMLVAYGFWVLFEHLRNRILRRMSARIDLETSPYLVQYALKNAQSSKHFEQATRDMDLIRSTATGPAVTALMDLPFSAVFLIFLYLIHPITFYFTAGVMLLVILLSIFAQRLNAAPQKEVGLFNRNLLAKTALFGRAFDIIKGFGKQDYVSQNYSQDRYQLALASMKSQGLSASLATIIKGTRFVAQSGIIGIAAWLVIQNAMHPALIFVAMVLMGRCLAPFDGIIGAWSQINESLTAWQRIKEIELEPQTSVSSVSTTTSPLTFQGTVRLENLGLWAQEDARQAVQLTAQQQAAPQNIAPPAALFENLTMQFQTQQFVLITGRSGTGKTSLLKVLAGIRQAQEGYVYFDNMILDAIPQDQRALMLGYCPQQPLFIPGTVAQNIAFGEDYDLDRLGEIANDLGLLEKISSLPMNWLSPIESLSGLSGGEQQRINIARALYRKPKLLLLDEPTSALDQQSGALVLNLLKKLSQQGHCVIIASHDPMVMHYATHILNLSNKEQLALQENHAKLARAIPQGKTPTTAAQQGRKPSIKEILAQNRHKQVDLDDGDPNNLDDLDDVLNNDKDLKP